MSDLSTYTDWSALFREYILAGSLTKLGRWIPRSHTVGRSLSHCVHCLLLSTGHRWVLTACEKDLWDSASALGLSFHVCNLLCWIENWWFLIRLHDPQAWYHKYQERLTVNQMRGWAIGHTFSTYFVVLPVTSLPWVYHASGSGWQQGHHRVWGQVSHCFRDDFS